MATADERATDWVRLDVATGALDWAPELSRRFRLSPGEAPSWERMAALCHPDDAAEVAAAVSACVRDGTPVAALHRVRACDVGAPDEWRWVVLGLTAIRSPDGAIERLIGRLLDVTNRQQRALAEWANAIVDRTLDSRAVIDQAKGALMLTYGLDAEAAFRLLVWQSKQTNVRVRELAERLVGATRGDNGTDVRVRLDEIIYEAAFRESESSTVRPPARPRTARSAGLEVREHVADATRVVALRGEIDLATAPALDAALRRSVTARPPQPVVVDLRDVRHLGSIGVGLLATHHQRARRNGVALRVLAGPGPVRAVLSLLAGDVPIITDPG